MTPAEDSLLPHRLLAPPAPRRPRCPQTRSVLLGPKENRARRQDGGPPPAFSQSHAVGVGGAKMAEGHVTDSSKMAAPMDTVRPPPLWR